MLLGTIDAEERMICVRVGWAAPISLEEIGNFHFNFHIGAFDIEWRDTISYENLEYLDSLVNQDTDEFKHIPFPNLDRKESFRLVNILQERVFNPESVKVLDCHRATIEMWINFILNNLVEIDDESRQLVKQLFFKTREKIEIFERMMFIMVKGYDNIEFGGVEEQKTDHGKVAVDNKKDGGEGQKDRRHSMFASIFKGRRPSSNNSSLALNKSNLQKHMHSTRYGKRGSAMKGRACVSNYSGEGEPRSLFPLHRTAATAVAPGDSNTVAGDETASKAGSSVFGKLKRKVTKSVSSETHRDREDEALAALAEVNKSTLLRVEVQRGQLTGSVQLYNLYLRVTGKQYSVPVVHRTHQRYNAFKLLNKRLVDINHQYSLNPTDEQQHTFKSAPYANFIHLIAAPFPQSPMKCYLGLPLTDIELSERTRMLDAWFRDLCSNYRDMPSAAREAVRGFLNFDMSSAKDIFLQDQLAWGVIEPNRKDSPVLIVQRSALHRGQHNGYLDELETISNADNYRNSNSGAAVDGAIGPFGAGKDRRADAGNKSRPVSVYSGGKNSQYSPEFGIEAAAFYGR